MSSNIVETGVKLESQHFLNIHDAAGKLLACIVRATFQPPKTTFLSQHNINPQYGIVTYPKGHKIKRHGHNPISRAVVGTPETLVVREGNIMVDIYDEKNELVNTYSLLPNDIIVLIAGGHGFTFIEDGWMFEVKQGPYDVDKDKFYF